MMTLKEAEKRLWKIEYTSLVNQYYNEILKHRWWWTERVLFTLSVLSSLAGVIVLGVGLFGATTQLPNPFEVGTGILGAVLFFLLLVIPVDNSVHKNEKLYMLWTDLRGKCEQLHLSLDASSAKQVDGRYLEQLEEIFRTHTDIQKQEGRAHEKLLLYCQREINKRTYAVSEGTYEEVMEKIGQLRSDIEV